MTGHQTAVFKMNENVEACLRNYQSIVDTVPALKRAEAELIENNNGIRNLMRIKQNKTEGITEDKNQLKGVLAKKAHVLAAAGFAYATENNIRQLQGQMNYSLSALEDLADDKLPETAQNIHDVLKPLLGDLADQGVTLAMLTNLQTAIDSFDAATTGPRQAIVQKKFAGEGIAKLLSENSDLLTKRMDKTMLIVADDEPTFYGEYKGSRVIVDTSVRHTEIKGVVTDAGTDKPIMGVVVIVEGVDKKEETNKAGEFVYRLSESGLYQVLLTHEDYEEVRLTEVDVTRGKATDVEVKLRRKG